MDATVYCKQTFLLGHFHNPRFPDTHGVQWNDLPKVAAAKKGTEAARQREIAYRSRSWSEAIAYRATCLDLLGREPDFDGELGPVMAATPRDCWVPDFPIPADSVAVDEVDDADFARVIQTLRFLRVEAEAEAGTGNWRGCNGVGQDWHHLAVSVNRSGINAAVNEIIVDAFKIVRRVLAGFGLLVTFVENGRDLVTGKPFSGTTNTDMSFVGRSSGWIGLATVMRNVGCVTQQWLKLLMTYTPADLLAKWVTLILHELGHNMGFDHQPGGVMNSYIVSRPSHEIASDDRYRGLLIAAYGGKPYPLDDDDNGDDNDDNGDTWRKAIADRIQRLETENAVQSSMIGFLLQRSYQSV